MDGNTDNFKFAWMKAVAITGTLGGLVDVVTIDAGAETVLLAFSAVRIELFRWDEGRRRGEFDIELSRQMFDLFVQLDETLKEALNRDQATPDRQAVSQIKRYLDGIIEVFLQRA